MGLNGKVLHRMNWTQEFSIEKKPITICVLLAPCTRGFIAYNGQSGIYNARKIDVNDQNIHLTWNISTWKRWNDWKSIVEKFVFFYWKKLHNLACISLKWDSTFQLNLIPTIWIHDMKSTWNRKVFLIWALKKPSKYDLLQQITSHSRI